MVSTKSYSLKKIKRDMICLRTITRANLRQCRVDGSSSVERQILLNSFETIPVSKIDPLPLKLGRCCLMGGVNEHLFIEASAVDRYSMVFVGSPTAPLVTVLPS